MNVADYGKEHPMTLNGCGRVTAALIALALGALLSAPVAAQAPRGLIGDGESPSLFLVYTGDMIGYIDACG